MAKAGAHTYIYMHMYGYMYLTGLPADPFFLEFACFASTEHAFAHVPQSSKNKQ